MTPLQFARAECSNFDQSTGACKGIGIKDDGRLYSFGPKPKCVLSDKGIRCQFFEECVMPMAARIESTPAAQLVRRQEYEEAVRTYRLGANVMTAVDRTCPNCHRPLEPRKRLCYVCRETARKASTRNAVQKHRSNVSS